MGLDMYLNKRSHKYRREDGVLTNNMNDIKFDDFGVSNGIDIVEGVAYWRKANQIHNWFVNNVQDGEDDCGDYYVSNNQLKELYNLCKDILKSIEGKRFYRPKKEGEDENTPEDYFIFHLNEIEDVRGKMCNYEVDLDEDMIERIRNDLNPIDGFFFGSTDLDGGYFYDLVKTVLMLDRIFATKDWEMNSYEYSSSW